MDRKGAMKIWQIGFGKAVETVDFAGRKINKSAYEQKFSKFGWTVVYKLPKSAGGTNDIGNFICVHLKTAEEKGDSYPYFTVNDKKYGIETDADGRYIITEATDSESLAEQQARTAEAEQKWDEFFGPGYDTAIDFCGRKILKSDYNTDSEYSWKVAAYVESKPAESRNTYIANSLTIEEALGKTAFKANGKSYTLNKENGAYFFKPAEIKPVKKVFCIDEPADMLNKLSGIVAKFSDENSLRVMLDFIVIRAVTKPGCTAGNAAAIQEAVSMILGEKIGECISSEFSEMSDESGARYMFMTFRYATPSPAELEKVFRGALLLNTYSGILSDYLNLEEFKIYNYADFADCEQVRYPVGLLAECNPTFKALMSSVYGSAYGYHAGESRRTLYVSHFIVYNIQSLQAMHPEDNTVYYTEAEMIEHNFCDEDVLTKISGGRASDGQVSKVGEETAENEETNTQADTETQNGTVCAQPVSEEETEAQSETVCDSSAEEAEIQSQGEVVTEEATEPQVETVVTESAVTGELEVKNDIANAAEQSAEISDEAQTDTITAQPVSEEETEAQSETACDVSAEEAEIQAPSESVTEEAAVAVTEPQVETVMTESAVTGELEVKNDIANSAEQSAEISDEAQTDTITAQPVSEEETKAQSETACDVSAEEAEIQAPSEAVFEEAAVAVTEPQVETVSAETVVDGTDNDPDVEVPGQLQFDFDSTSASKDNALDLTDSERKEPGSPEAVSSEVAGEDGKKKDEGYIPTIDFDSMFR